MTIRGRLTWWYAGILFFSLALIFWFSLGELNERRQRIHHTDHGEVELIEIMLGIAAPAGVLSVAGGWWLTRRSLAPLTALTAAAERVSENSSAERLPRTQNGDELDRLTGVFNDMTARVHDSFQRIREFTLHASHELKTPLTVMCGEIEMALQDEGLSPDERERWASQLEEARRLSRIVDALTLLAKADAGLAPLSLSRTPFDELVRDSFADAQILAQAANVRVELAECEPAAVMGNAHRLRQLLLNLADNAVKYNEPGGRVTMTLQRRKGEALFKIANTGPGVAPEMLMKVFDRFFRGDPAHASDIEGSGLGLSIARWIVTAHNGTIQMESVPGKLTTVTVEIPVME